MLTFGFVILSMILSMILTSLTLVIITSYLINESIINVITSIFFTDMYYRKRSERLKSVVPEKARYCCKRKMCLLYFIRTYLEWDIGYYFIQFDDTATLYKQCIIKCNICSSIPTLLCIPNQRNIFNTQLYACRVIFKSINCSNFVCFDCAKGHKIFKNISSCYTDVIIKHK